MVNDNILKVSFSGSKNALSNPLWQYDYGQILQIKGIALPSVYEVHFGKDKTGTSVTAIGTEDGVAIPDELLETEGTIYAWVYLHSSESDGETRYQINIPITKRAKPTHEEPTPVQQSEIERLIALAEEIVEHGGSGGGSDGFSPVVTVTEITGGYQLSIQDKTHTETFNIMDGQDGQDGTNGTNGTDGSDGQDGVSPTITITEITGGHTVTITDAEHPNGISFNVMDGTDGHSPYIGQNGNWYAWSTAQNQYVDTQVKAQGEDGDDYVLTAQDKADIASLVDVETATIQETLDYLDDHYAMLPVAEGVGF